MNSNLLKVLLLIFLLGDLFLAWQQYLHFPIDGDLYAVVLPAPWYAEVLQDPFGMNALLQGIEYGGAGRYSAHWVMTTYFHHAPSFFQNFVSPIQSIYYSAAFLKISMYLGLLLLMAAYVTGHYRVLSKNYLLAACATIPFIQTYGMYNRMGIIDGAMTYALFYIFPLIILLALMFPIYKYFMGGRPVNSTFSLGWWTVPWLLAAWCLAFFGPQSQFLMGLTGAMTIGSLVIFHSGDISFRNRMALPFHKRHRQLSFLLIAMIAFAGLGYLTGLQNVENLESLPVKEAFSRALKGLKFYYIEPWHVWGILIFLGIHFLGTRHEKDSSVRWFQRMFLFTLAGLGIYLIVLPFGGYRSYRPMIYRYDLLIPVTLCSIYWVLASGKLFLKYAATQKTLRWYLPLVLLFLGALHFHDLGIEQRNQCEKEKLQKLSASQADTVILENDCPVLGWEPDDNYYYTNEKVKLLRLWGILDRDVKYIQE